MKQFSIGIQSIALIVQFKSQRRSPSFAMAFIIAYAHLYAWYVVETINQV